LLGDATQLLQKLGRTIVRTAALQRLNQHRGELTGVLSNLFE
jgi:hypothetical protein